jgi:uncharacterized protein YhhL (DUF1145 family)
MVTTFLKMACLTVYAMALAGLAGWLQDELARTVQVITLVALFLHALEAPFVLAYLRRDQSPLAVGVLQTLLFGVLHWMPLTRKQGPPRPPCGFIRKI